MTVPGARDDGRRRAEGGPKTARRVAAELVDQIVSRQLPPGTLLPPEAQMLEEFGVGRGSLREALRILEMAGVIAMKPGRNGGPVVMDADARDLGRMSTLFFRMAGMTLQQLVDARVAVEPILARLAAEHRGAAAGGHVPGVLDGAAEDDAAHREAAQSFHRTVAAMSGNPVLGLIATCLESIVEDQAGALFEPGSGRGDLASAHQHVAAAIEERRADDAEKLMRQHMETYAAYLRAHHSAQLDRIIDWT